MPHKLRIFYFDDDARQLELFEEFFGDKYDVHTATALAAARSVLTECQAEIIISDQRMPEIKGTDFLREVARVCPKSFRVLLTGAVTVGSILSEVSAGIIHIFLAKPWTETEMTDVLERAEAFLDFQRKPDRERRGRKKKNSRQ